MAACHVCHASPPGSTRARIPGWPSDQQCRACGSVGNLNDETAVDEEFRLACTISAVRHRQQTGHDAARVPGTFTVRCVECDREWVPSLTAEEG